MATLYKTQHLKEFMLVSPTYPAIYIYIYTNLGIRNLKKNGRVWHHTQGSPGRIQLCHRRFSRTVSTSPKAPSLRRVECPWNELKRKRHLMMWGKCREISGKCHQCNVTLYKCINYTILYYMNILQTYLGICHMNAFILSKCLLLFLVICPSWNWWIEAKLRQVLDNRHAI